MFNLKEKITAQAKTEATHLIAVKTARTLRNAAAKTVESAKEQVVQTEAKRGDLALDDEAIRKHLDAENLAKLRLQIAEKKAVLAEAALIDAQRNAEQAAKRAAYDRALDAQNAIAARFQPEYEKLAKALDVLLQAAVASEAECERVNSALPDGAEEIRSLVLGVAFYGAMALRIELIDQRGESRWTGAAP
jgi:hypothetical protein